MAFIYDATSKLKFNEDPILKIRDTELTIKSDADILLEVIDIMQKESEMEAARKMTEILLSDEDRGKLTALHLKMEDYMEVMHVMVSLALGENPDDKEKN